MKGRNDLSTNIEKKRTLADGAMGTMLFTKKHKVNSPLVAINLTDPEAIIKIHKNYISAGSRLLLTHTFALPSAIAANQRLPVRRIIKAAVSNGRTAIGKRDCALFGNLGATGLTPDTINDHRKETASRYYHMCKTLVTNKVTGLWLETFTSIVEAAIAVKAARKAAGKKIPIILTLTPRPDGKLHDTTAASRWMGFLNHCEADYVGINCVVPNDNTLDIVKKMKKRIRKPLALKLSAGLPGKIIQPKIFAPFVKKCLEGGNVFVVGGCCNSTPAHIKKLATILR